MGIDPGTLRELLEEWAVEAARGTVIDILDGGLMAQPGIAQAGVQPPDASCDGEWLGAVSRNALRCRATIKVRGERQSG
jgi:hypothetical protein